MSSCDMETNLHVILEFLPHKQRKFSSVVIRFWINCHYCLYYEHYILICFHLNPRNYSFFVGSNEKKYYSNKFNIHCSVNDYSYVNICKLLNKSGFSLAGICCPCKLKKKIQPSSGI